MDMICILSQAGQEVTTEEVIDWLRFWQIPYVRLNGEDIRTSSLSISIGGSKSSLSVQAGDVTVAPESIKVVWYRRWANTLLALNANQTSVFDSKILFTDTSEKEWQNRMVDGFHHLRQEMRAISRFIYDDLSSARWLSSPDDNSINKLLVLKGAAECGIDTPDTIVSNHRSTLLSFAAKYPRVITKAISGMFTYRRGDSEMGAYTAIVDTNILARYQNDLLFPVLLQECLNKQYEIRAFYLDRRFYSMAIFSQSDEQTSVDFRRYQYRRPNRTVPYQIQDALEFKLTTLMDRLGLETGSLDLVKTVDGRTVFLEVNPVGQFGMVSHPCNYHLERAVASALVRRLNNE
jgi:ATP-GRASP peptide maturase of grasp-with-spasm system